MKNVTNNLSDWEATHNSLMVKKEDLVETKALLLWNSYLSNNEYYSRYRQIFSIVGFMSLENYDGKGKGIIETMIEI